MRIVFDTNVLIAAFIASGVSKEVFEFAVTHDEVFVSPYLIGEFKRVLVSKFHFPPKEVNEAADLLKDFMMGIGDEPLFDRIPRVSDRADWPVLWFAHKIQAHLLVTGDKELLKLGQFGRTRIVNPSQYWRLKQE